MRLLTCICMLAVPAAACTAPEPPEKAEARPEQGLDLQARLDAAECRDVQAIMAEADAARREAPDDGPSANDVARVVTMLVPIPGLGLLRRAATAAAKASADEPEPVDPEVLYQTARATYAERGCRPAAEAGEALASETGPHPPADGDPGPA